ncbi:MAG: hypothetical protein BMS9Abin12_1911 [Acidimicrobiia bacterium]|nr:MAG: hypothetical protein BMS9Abin12_1911 [Acidimicrobiia bacterium]
MGKLAIVVIGASVFVLVTILLVYDRGVQPAIEATDLESLYNPVHAGEEQPSGFRQLLPRDAIRPIYEPEFLSAAETGWPDETLVVGLEIDGDARAYAVSYLNRREIVNDHVGKTPVLVTW